MQGYRRCIWWALLVLLAQAGWSKPPTPQQAIDSLQRLLRQSGLADTTRAFSWIALAQAQAKAGEPSTVWNQSVRRAIALARRSPNAALKVSVFTRLAGLYYKRSEVAKGAALYRQALSSAGHDTLQRAEVLLHWAEDLRRVQRHTDALELLEEALKLEARLPPAKRALLYRFYGNNLGDMGRTEEAINWTQRSYDLYVRLGIKSEQAYVLGSLAAHVTATGDNLRALKLFQQAARLAEAEGLDYILADVYNNISLVYAGMNEPVKSREYLERALVLNRRLNRKHAQLVNLLNLAGALHDEHRFAESAQLSREAIQLADSLKQEHHVGIGWLILGLVYSSTSQHAQSLEALNQARRYLNADQTQNYISYLNALAGTLIALNRAAEARASALQALELAQRADMQIEISQAAQALYRADSALGNWESAFRYSQLHHGLRHELANSEQLREIGRVESKLEMQKQLVVLEKEKALEQARLEARLARRRSEAWALGGGLLLAAAVALLLWNRNRLRQRANQTLAALNAEIQAVNSQLNETLVEVQQQRDQISRQHQRIRDSIEYASRIQAGMLPEATAIATYFAQSALFYWPRDIVSGDFYWLLNTNDRLLWAVADCTGHGVPGAFMSLIAKSQLDRLAEGLAHDPAALLEALDAGVRQSLQQHNRSDRLDGLDLGLCVWEPAAGRLLFTGANRPLWVLRAAEVIEYAPTPRALGGQTSRKNQPFETSVHQLAVGDRLLLFSDGIVDQFGPTDPQRKRPLKWGTQRLREFMLNHRLLPLAELSVRFVDDFRTWMGDQNQLDDCTWWCVELPGAKRFSA
jgi:serine phosphatase RsbU (regulator of sigma subunit)